MTPAGRARLVEAALNLGRAMFEYAAALERLDEEAPPQDEEAVSRRDEFASEPVPSLAQMEKDVRGVSINGEHFAARRVRAAENQAELADP